jgi:hypothetical protein
MECEYCGKEIESSNSVQKSNLNFCNNLCRFSFEDGNIKGTTTKKQKQNVNKPNSKKLTTMIGFIIFIVLGSFLGNKFGADLASNFFEKTTITSELIQQTVNEINMNLPFMIDSETELFTTVGIGDKIQYHYRLINMTEDQINTEELKTYLVENIKNSSCTIEETRKLLDQNIKLEYIYHDKNNIYLMRYILDKKICEESGL